VHSLAAANILASDARRLLLIGGMGLVLGTLGQTLFLTLMGTASLGASAALVIVRRRFLPKGPQ
jgi:hypothetical protein